MTLILFLGPFKSCFGMVCFVFIDWQEERCWVFLGREGSSICITKRFEQQVLF